PRGYTPQTGFGEGPFPVGRPERNHWRLGRLFRESEQILALVRQNSSRIDPFVLLSRPATAADQLRCARNWSRRFSAEPVAVFGHLCRTPSAEIRLGYLSEDFQVPAVAELLATLIERHDPS